MEIKKIEIGIKDIKKYTDIALLVDKKDFMQWIAKLREKWKIDKLFKAGEYRKFYAFIWREDDRNDKNWSDFLSDVKKIRKTYNLTPNFDEVIKYAIGFGFIPDHAYRTCYVKEIISSPDEIEEYAIVVTPNTTKKEIDSVFMQFKKDMKQSLENVKDESKMDKVVAKYKFTYEFGPMRKDFDQISTIETIRAWYWALYGDIVNGKTSKPRKYNEGWSFCPRNQVHKTAMERVNCPFCSVKELDPIHHSLSAYLKRLKEN